VCHRRRLGTRGAGVRRAGFGWVHCCSRLHARAACRSRRVRISKSLEAMIRTPHSPICSAAGPSIRGAAEVVMRYDLRRNELPTHGPRRSLECSRHTPCTSRPTRSVTSCATCAQRARLPERLRSRIASASLRPTGRAAQSSAGQTARATCAMLALPPRSRVLTPALETRSMAASSRTPAAPSTQVLEPAATRYCRGSSDRRHIAAAAGAPMARVT
jgi:hypothetical protein